MTVTQILKFKFTCDGRKPDNWGCPCDMVIEAVNEQSAEAKAYTYGWSKDASQRWLCNARDGHA